MSGHSKWSKVKHQKATTDVVKAKAFTKATHGIMIAVQEGGGLTDPNGNFKLRLAIEQARAVNMPKENIERAIAKAGGENGKSLESLIYEGYGPDGVALIITAASENRQRTVSAVKNALDRHGGVLAAQGAVAFQFEKVGVVVLDKPSGKTDDDLLLLSLDVGAHDILILDSIVEIYTTIADLAKIKELVEKEGYTVHSAEIMFRPTLPISVSEETMNRMNILLEVLEELDDVQEVYTNLS